MKFDVLAGFSFVNSNPYTLPSQLKHYSDEIQFKNDLGLRFYII
jgi:hypothetical protein